MPTGSKALEVARNGGIDAVLSDIYMPDGGGLDLVKDLRQIDPTIPIILMTAQGSVEAAVRAMAEGATDFIGKPFDVAAVVELLRRHLGARREAESAQASSTIESVISRSGLVGRSAPMVMVYKLIAQAARSDATVLILGESGTGKELVARAIHDFSTRSSRPFLSVNCSGLTDTLLESELFGYMRGAFTGATGDRARPFRSSRRRHAISRRIGLHKRGVSSEPAACVAKWRSAAHRLHSIAPGQRARDRREQRATARFGGRRNFPGRPLLPSQRVSVLSCLRCAPVPGISSCSPPTFYKNLAIPRTCRCISRARR